MNKKIMTFGVSLAAITAGFGCMNMGHGDASAMTPSAVHDALVRAAGGSKIETIEKEDEDGATVYEAKFHVDGVERTVSADASGKVLEEETEVKVADLPPAVSAAVLKAQPLIRVKEASIVKKGDQSRFEIDGKVGDEKHELAIATDGKLMSDKTEADEDDHSGQGDDDKKHGEQDTD